MDEVASEAFEGYRVLLLTISGYLRERNRHFIE